MLNHFALSFCMMLLHSLWQSALLLLSYSVSCQILKPVQPLYKRRFLFLALFMQCFFAAITFSIYFYNAEWLWLSRFISLPGIFKTDANFSWPTVLLSIYALVAIFKATDTFLKWHRFKSQCKSNLIKPSAGLKLFMNARALEMGLIRKVNFWYSDVVTTPLTFGYFKPVILLPVALVNQISTKEAESIIIHELSHIRQNDYLMNWLLLCTEYIFHFNPFLLQIGKQIRLERELQCDLQVMNYQYDPITYAETLLKTARIKQSPMLFHLPAFRSKSQLQKRISFFTNDKNISLNQNKVGGIGLSLIITCLVLGYISCMVVFPSLPKKNRTTSLDQLYKIRNNIKPENAITAAITLQQPQPVSEKKSVDDDKLILAPIQRTDISNTISNQSFSNTEDIQTIDEHFAIPVAAVDAPKEKLMFIEEQDPANGLTLTKAFLMNYVDGEWKMNLLWIMNEFKPQTDSCGNPVITPYQLEAAGGQ
jgi:beta-lactamase regulating signal transducer with metallopeptidase domain